MNPRVDPHDLMEAVKTVLTEFRRDFRAALENTGHETITSVDAKLHEALAELADTRAELMAEVRAKITDANSALARFDTDHQQVRLKAETFLTTIERTFMDLEKRMAEAIARIDTIEPIPGEKGEPGKDGERGEDGKDGQDGKDGEPGKDGAPGADGKDGVDGQPGADGKDGVDGAPGQPGRDGIDGKDGEPGTNGLDGKDGVNGKDGEPGRDGKDGTDGRPGRDGKDGERGPPGHDGLGLEPMGAWKPQWRFHHRDVVSWKGGSWCAVRNTQAGEEPGNESNPDNPAWMVFSLPGQRGVKGLPGERGPRGEKGERGEPGARGERGPGIAKLAWDGWRLCAADEDGTELEPVEFTAFREELGAIVKRLEALEK